VVIWTSSLKPSRCRVPPQAPARPFHEAWAPLTSAVCLTPFTSLMLIRMNAMHTSDRFAAELQQWRLSPTEFPTCAHSLLFVLPRQGQAYGIGTPGQNLKNTPYFAECV
jgi:hypothetical protein